MLLSSPASKAMCQEPPLWTPPHFDCAPPPPALSSHCCSFSCPFLPLPLTQCEELQATYSSALNSPLLMCSWSVPVLFLSSIVRFVQKRTMPERKGPRGKSRQSSVAGPHMSFPRPTLPSRLPGWEWGVGRGEGWGS